MSAPTPAPERQHRSRLQETDPDYLRLKEATQTRLSASLARLVRELRTSASGDTQTALSAFVRRQTAILRDAYVASYSAGALDYFSEVSNHPASWSRRLEIDPDRMAQALSFYAPSVAKMANEALAAVNATPDVRLEEALAEAIQLSFGGFAPRSGARPTGGFGAGQDRAIYGPHHQFAGSRSGGQHEHESQRSIHEHLAAHRSEEGAGAGGGKASARLTFDNERAVRGAFKGMFGRHLSDHEITNLVGARKGDLITMNGGSNKATNYHAVDFKVTGHNHSYTAERSLMTGRDGVIMGNVEIHVTDTGHSLGAEIFARQVRQLSLLGAHHINTVAGGSGDGTTNRRADMIGYYVWARMGYNGRVQWSETPTREAITKTTGFQRATTIRDIMKTAHVDVAGVGRMSGAEWWRRFGHEFTGEFDLHAGSESMKILDAYLAERGITVEMNEILDRPSALLLSDAESEGHEEIEWTEEDEAAAERAWRKLYPELPNDGAVRQDEENETEDSVKLRFGSSVARAAGRPRSTGGAGSDRATYGTGHRFTGSREGQHSQSHATSHGRSVGTQATVHPASGHSPNEEASRINSARTPTAARRARSVEEHAAAAKASAKIASARRFQGVAGRAIAPQRAALEQAYRDYRAADARHPNEPQHPSVKRAVEAYQHAQDNVTRAMSGAPNAAREQLSAAQLARIDVRERIMRRQDITRYKDTKRSLGDTWHNHDETGQQMPFSRGQFDEAIGRMRAVTRGRGVGVNLSGRITINGRDYFVKRIVDAYHTPHTEAINEVFANKLAHQIGMGDAVAHEAFYLARAVRGPDGPEIAHYNVLSFEQGMHSFASKSRFLLGERPGGHIEPALAETLRGPTASHHAILEYLIADGRGDRHQYNIMFDGRSRIMQIDFGREFPREAGYDPRDHVLSSFTVRAHVPQIPARQFSSMFHMYAGVVKLDRAFLQSVASQRATIMRTAVQHGLYQQGGLSRRLDVIEQLARGRNDPNLMDLYFAGKASDEAAGLA